MSRRQYGLGRAHTRLGAVVCVVLTVCLVVILIGPWADDEDPDEGDVVVDHGDKDESASPFQRFIEQHLPAHLQRTLRVHRFGTAGSRPASCGNAYRLDGGRLVPPVDWLLHAQETRYVVEAGEHNLTVPSWSALLLEKGGVEETSEWMRNRSVIVIGDSLDRNGVYHLAVQLDRVGFKHYWLDSTTASSLPKLPTTPSHLVGVTRHDGLNFTLANWFLMSTVGSSAEHDTEEEPFHHPGEDMPQYWQSRLEQLYLPSVEHGLLSSPSVVVVSMSLWDVFWFAFRDNTRPAGSPLLESELSHHRDRTVQLLQWVREHFPKARIVLRTIHDPSEKADGQASDVGRIRQLRRSALELVEFGAARSLVDDIMPWGEKVKGREEEMLDGIIHFGRGAAQWLYHDMILDQLRRHVLGSVRSEWSECRRYRRLLQQ